MRTHIIDELRPELPEVDPDWEAQTVRAILDDRIRDVSASSHHREQRGLVRALLVAATVTAVVGGTFAARDLLPTRDARPAGALPAATAPDGNLANPALEAEYDAAKATIGADFPDDVELPSLSERLGSLPQDADGNVTFADGFGETVLVTVWRCAWERSLLNANGSGDGNAESRAQRQLSKFYDLEIVKRTVSDPDRMWETEVVKPALAGDLGALRADLINSCGEPFTP